jgi:hypothetical protein
MRKSKRRNEREPFSARLQIGWEGEHGETRFERVQCVDISEHGMRLRSERPIPVRTAVMIRSDEKDLTIPGRATVRYCEQARGRYYVGLEFSGKLTWSAQAAPSDAA